MHNSPVVLRSRAAAETPPVILWIRTRRAVTEKPRIKTE